MKISIQRIGTDEFIQIKKHAREFYLPLKAETVNAFGLRAGQTLKIRIVGVVIPDENKEDRG